MKLEQQIAALADLGLKLNEGITIDDLLHSCDREEFEEQPFDLIFYVFGFNAQREPRGRAVCSRVWNFDTECIDGAGSYTRIVRRLCEVAGDTSRLLDITDHIDFAAGKAWIEYCLRGGGVKRHWDVKINRDWADMSALSEVMGEDIERGDEKFYFKDNGQAMVLLYLDPTRAAVLNILSRGAFKPVVTR